MITTHYFDSGWHRAQDQPANASPSVVMREFGHWVALVSELPDEAQAPSWELVILSLADAPVDESPSLPGPAVYASLEEAQAAAYREFLHTVLGIA